ncbi:putative uncharacterized protein DDB_G0289963 [Clytia hemisphaerica]|uniref:Uncharacterized protein n=1 Tax=Clytia hemisphaerica TaxID=252671 RepID=A0A7M6DR93_9CNID
MATNNNTFVDQVISLFTRDIYLDQPNFRSLLQALNKLGNQDLVLAYPIKLLNKRAKEDPVGWDTMLFAFKCPNDVTADVLSAQNETASKVLEDDLTAMNKEKKLDSTSEVKSKRKSSLPDSTNSEAKKDVSKQTPAFKDNNEVLESTAEMKTDSNKSRRKSSAQMTEEILASLEILEQPLVMDGSNNSCTKLISDVEELKVAVEEESIAAEAENVQLEQGVSLIEDTADIGSKSNHNIKNASTKGESSSPKEDYQNDDVGVIADSKDLEDPKDTSTNEENTDYKSKAMNNDIESMSEIAQTAMAGCELTDTNNLEKPSVQTTKSDIDSTIDVGDGLSIANDQIDANGKVEEIDDSFGVQNDKAGETTSPIANADVNNEKVVKIAENAEVGVSTGDRTCPKVSENVDVNLSGEETEILKNVDEDEDDWYGSQSTNITSDDDNDLTEDGGLQLSSFGDDRRRSSNLKYAGVPLLETIQENGEHSVSKENLQVEDEIVNRECNENKNADNDTVHRRNNAPNENLSGVENGNQGEDSDRKFTKESINVLQDLDHEEKNNMKALLGGNNSSDYQDVTKKSRNESLDQNQNDISTMENSDDDNSQAAKNGSIEITNVSGIETSTSSNSINIYGMETDQNAYNDTSLTSTTQHRVSFGDSDIEEFTNYIESEPMMYRNFFSSTSSGVNSNRSSVSSVSDHHHKSTLDLSADPTTKSHPYHLFTRVVTDMENGCYPEDENLEEDQGPLSPINKESYNQKIISSPINSPMMAPHSSFGHLGSTGRHYDFDESLNMDIFDIIHKMRQKTGRVINKQSKVNMQYKMTSRLTYDY